MKNVFYGYTIINLGFILTPTEIHTVGRVPTWYDRIFAVMSAIGTIFAVFFCPRKVCGRENCLSYDSNSDF